MELHNELRDSLLETTAVEEREDSDAWSVKRWTLGLTLVALQVVTNVASAELMQEQEQAIEEFNSPYFSVWFNHSFTGIACLLIASAILLAEGMSKRRRGQTPRTNLLQIMGEEAGLTSWKRVWLVSLWLVVLYKYNVFWAAGVALTSVSVFSAISQSSCVVVFILSVLFLKERVTRGKIGALTVCVSGVVLVSMQQHDESDTSTSTIGLLWTFVYTIGAAVYLVCYKHEMNKAFRGRQQVNTGEDADTGAVLEGREANQQQEDAGAAGAQETSTLGAILVLGFMGLSNIILLWPPMFIVGGPNLNVDPGVLRLPHGRQWQLVVANAALAEFSNVTLMAGIVVTSPMFMAVGMVLQIPCAAVADAVLHGKHTDVESAIGYVLIVIGFLWLAGQQRQRKRQESGKPE